MTIINFFTDEGFAADDENLACTTEFKSTGYGDNEVDCWSVRIADSNSPTEHPVINEDTTGTGEKNFDTEDELIEWMSRFGYRPV